MKKYLFILQLMMISMAVGAQSLTVNAPSRVQTGENFRLTYTVNTQEPVIVPDGERTYQQLVVDYLHVHSLRQQER